MHDLYTQRFQKYHWLTDWLVVSGFWMVVCLVLSLTFVGSRWVLELGPVSAAVTCVMSVSVSMRVFSVVGLRWCRGGEILSMAWSAVSQCFIQFAQSPSSCHRAITSFFLRSSVVYRVHPLPLSLSLLGCSGGSWTIEADGCAWQNYWAVQPKHRWHSPLKSLPRSLACWKKETGFYLFVKNPFLQ